MNTYETERVAVFNADCLEALKLLPDASIDSCVTDPPYGLSKEPDVALVLGKWLAGEDYQHRGGGFMGKSWDSFVPGPSVWREVFRVLKPGGHLLVFAGTRTEDLMGMSVRLAGFERRDTFAWMYGSGFPKSLDVSKAIDRELGKPRGVSGTGEAVDRTALDFGGATGKAKNGLKSAFVRNDDSNTADAKKWSGFGTALKPAHEPILVFRKPLADTVASNVLEHGVGAMNIDGCRVEADEALVRPSIVRNDNEVYGKGLGVGTQVEPAGRWPPNVLLGHGINCDPSGECAPGCPIPALDRQSGTLTSGNVTKTYIATEETSVALGKKKRHLNPDSVFADSGGASRFFPQFRYEEDDFAPFLYQAKAARKEREEGCTNLPSRTGAETVDREEGSAGLNNPRAGAGRTAKEVKNHHPTVKPVALMRWLVRLVTPPGGMVLDPYTGSGTTGVATLAEGFNFVGVELDCDGNGDSLGYMQIIQARLELAEFGTGAPEQEASVA